MATEDAGRLREIALSLKASHLYALAAKMNGIAGSIINDLDRLEKGNGE